MRDDRPRIRSFRLFSGGPRAELAWAAVLVFAVPVALAAVSTLLLWAYG